MTPEQELDLARVTRLTGLVVICGGVVLLTYGTHLQSSSPRFVEYMCSLAEEMCTSHPGEDIGPAVGAGLALVHHWPVVGLCSTCVALLFAVAVTSVSRIARSKPLLAGFLGGVFASGCLLGMLISLAQALESNEWGFRVLASGYVLCVFGLALGAVSTAALCLIPSSSRALDA